MHITPEFINTPHNARMLMPVRLLALLMICLLTLVITPYSDVRAETKLRVAIKPLTPFVMQAGPGEGYEGYSIDLWNTIATKNGWTTEFKMYKNVKEVLDAVKNGETDVGIAGISITKEREAILDFSVPMFNAGLQILAPIHAAFDPLQALKSLASPQLGFIALIIFACIVIAGHVVWVSHRCEPGFPKGYLRGVTEGMWWGLVHLPQNSLGDHNPRSLFGRLLSVLWLVICLVLLANFTASVTANLTVQQIQDNLSSVNDLPGKRVVTVKGTTAEAYLIKHNIRASSLENIQAAYDQLGANTADAVVYDAPVLQYYASHQGKGKVIVVGEIFKPEYYGIALPIGSPMRKAIDQTLTEMIADGTQIEIQQRWFGSN